MLRLKKMSLLFTMLVILSCTFLFPIRHLLLFHVPVCVINIVSWKASVLCICHLWCDYCIISTFNISNVLVFRKCWMFAEHMHTYACMHTHTLMHAYAIHIYTHTHIVSKWQLESCKWDSTQSIWLAFVLQCGQMISGCRSTQSIWLSLCCSVGR